MLCYVRKSITMLPTFIKKQISNQYLQALNSITKKEILDQIEKNHQIDLPQNLIDQEISIMTQNLKPEEIQTIVYATGKENGYEKNLRDWFKLIYEVVFGEENGLSMGFFISFFGLNETIELINNKIK